MGSLYHRTAVYCRTCRVGRATIADRAACKAANHHVEDRISTKWMIQYQNGNGRAITESTGTSDRKKANQLLNLREGAIARGQRIVTETITYDDALTLVETDYATNAQTSWPDARGRIKHLTPFFTGMKLASITTAKIREYQKHRLGEERLVSAERTTLEADGTVTVIPEVRKKPSNAQINRETAMLRRMFSLAKEDDRIVAAPAFPQLEEPKQPRKGFFEHAEFVKVRDLLEPQFRNIVAFMYSTGWRIQSEVLPLQWSQIDFAAGEVRLTGGTTKSGEPRVFPLTEDLRRVLIAQKRLTTRRGSAYVFCNLASEGRGKAGTPISYGGFFKAWLRAVNAAGLPTLRPHDFRRTAIRNLERDGVARSVAMALVGHQTEEVYRRYAIVDEAMRREATVKMNRGATTHRTTAKSTAKSKRDEADT